MSRFILLEFCLLLLCAIWLAEAPHNTIKITNMVNNIFNNKGWINLNDVEKGIFFNKNYIFEEIFKTPNTRSCDRQIRGSTIILACSYMKDFKLLIYVFKQFIIHCRYLNNSTILKIMGYECATKFLNVINKIPLLVTIMEGSLMALDSLHTKPWDTGKNYYTKSDYMFIKVSTMFHSMSFKDILLSSNDSSSINNILKTIDMFFINIESEINIGIKGHCEYKPYILDSLWKNLNEEYKNTSFSKNKNQRLYDYLSKKLYHKFLTIIYDKYHNLGFDYDLKTKKIFTREQLKSIEIDSNLQLNSECGIKLKLENEDSYERESDNQSKNNEIIELIKFLNEGLNPDSILEEHD
ncbi:uncharacterized protein LOC126894683 isoform X1 [Daktulosphaira vitifoliae]|uniref:uncharacterized protein LOC126894683 isoform X1 n=1 Tax=Daktulosphaira vitifoliae TaxID=58002 RepID=UPI0021AA0CE7|nr:uncharacterized protein LOC126894683 isoform X1 [Daktulosphaira vitifoliae]